MTAPRPSIVPRSDWGGDLVPTGPLMVEADGDVKALLIHHSASTNRYGSDEVRQTLRGFQQYHTGPAKGWPDVAYNFFVDRFGGIWEGRTGSLDRPVIGDATGGNQGFTQLCCFVGDHSTDAPTEAAQTAMVSLLAWLADRYGVDPTPGATTTFPSRGSNKWPAGRSVTISTISGHRDCSQTACPGDAAYTLVHSTLPTRVTALVDGTEPTPSTAPPTTAPPSTVPPTATAPAATSPASTTTPTSTTGPAASTTGAPTSSSAAAAAEGAGGAAEKSSAGQDAADDPLVWPAISVGAGTALAILGGAIALRRRRDSDVAGESDPTEHPA